MTKVKRWFSVGVSTIFLLFLFGCQSLPAVTPTSAEIVDIQITVQPEASPELVQPTEAIAAPPAYPSPPANPSGETSYPGTYPSAQTYDPYLAPGAQMFPTLEPYNFKTGQPGTATLRGTLVVFDPLVMVPAPDDAIYLVPIASGESGPATIPSIEKGKTPQAEVDERTGDFVFTNIQPGQYAVVVLTNGGSEIPARGMEKNDLIIVTVKDSDIDQTIDLGFMGL